MGTTVTESLQKIIVADLAPGVRDAKIAMDRIFTDIVDTSEAVFQDSMGQDWKVIHTYTTNVAGAIKAYSNALGDNYSYTGAGGTAWTKTPRTWQGLGKTIAPGYMQRTVTLKEWFGNMHIPMQLTRASRLTNAITDGASMLIKQTAKMVAQAKAAIFFAETSTKDIATVLAVTGSGEYDGGTTHEGATFTITTGRIRRFQPGMLVSIYDGSTLQNDASDPIAVVEAVDPLNKTLTVRHITSGAVWAHQVAAGNTIHLFDSKSAGPSGLNDFLVASGTITPLALDTDTYPQFRSQITASLGSLLTDAALRQKLGEFMDAYGPDMFIDTLLTTSGVIAGWISETDDLRRYDVQGTAVNVKGGFSGEYSFVYDGQPVKMRSSAMVTAGTLYGLKLRGGNWKRYAPPRLPNASGNQYFNGDIEFVAPTFGVNGIWMPALYNSEVTEQSQAPFVSIEEYAPEQVQGMKIGGISEWTT